MFMRAHMWTDSLSTMGPGDESQVVSMHLYLYLRDRLNGTSLPIFIYI